MITFFFAEPARFETYSFSTPFRFVWSNLLTNNEKLFESLSEVPQGTSSSPRTKMVRNDSGLIFVIAVFVGQSSKLFRAKSK